MADPHPLDIIRANRARLLDSIAQAAHNAKRAPADVTLVAVSKKQPETRIDAALELGQRVFGENRVQEAQGRWADRRAAFPDLELRLVGPLQTNKVRDAVALFDVIETLDREKLAAALAQEIQRQGRAPRLYVQVNTGEEPQKAGVAPLELGGFLERLRDIHGLAIEGLMCLPPAGEEPALHFALLADMAARNGISRLSMGMSGDYETAVMFGATSVRVGTGFFGPRPAQSDEAENAKTPAAGPR